jgi:predicted dehydrogenase
VESVAKVIFSSDFAASFHFEDEVDHEDNEDDEKSQQRDDDDDDDDDDDVTDTHTHTATATATVTATVTATATAVTTEPLLSSQEIHALPHPVTENSTQTTLVDSCTASNSEEENASLALAALQVVEQENEELVRTVAALTRAIAEKNIEVERVQREKALLESHIAEEDKREVVPTVFAVEQAHRNRTEQMSKNHTIQEHEVDEVAHIPRALRMPYPAFEDPSGEKGRVLQVGLICFGLSGRVFHAPFVLGHPRFRLTAVYERTKSLAQEFTEQHGLKSIKTCRRVEDLVSRADVDLVVVCSPIDMHFQHAMLALQAGKHVLVEKAFTTTSAEAVELFRLAKQRRLVCVPYQNRRYDSDFRTIQRCLPQVGAVTEFHGYFNRFKLDIRDTWKDQNTTAGGNFLSLGSHMIDQAICLFGSPKSVWADIRAHRPGSVVDDAWEVHLYYESQPGTKPHERSDKQEKQIRDTHRTRPPPLIPASRGGTSAVDKQPSPPPKRMPPKPPLPSKSSHSMNKDKLSPDVGCKVEENNPTCPSPSGSHAAGYIHRGGFRVVLRGSLLCADHALRYMVHGTNGSWRKDGMDPQEELLMSGHLPAYPSTTHDNLTGKPNVSFHGYGVERKKQWGLFTSSDGSTYRTVPELGSYFMFYDELYNCIVHKCPPPVDEREALDVLDLIEVAKLSSLRGEVIDFRNRYRDGL